MFDKPGFGPAEIAWIRRDQFIYYVELEHALTDPADWVALRPGLVAALTAAFGLDSPGPFGDPTHLTPRQVRAPAAR